MEHYNKQQFEHYISLTYRLICSNREWMKEAPLPCLRTGGTRHVSCAEPSGCTNPVLINRLKPNDPYMGRTAPLISKRCILYIYSTNIGTEYFKHALYSPFFLSSKCSLFHNANLFGSCIIHILYTECAKIKKKK